METLLKISFVRNSRTVRVCPFDAFCRDFLAKGAFYPAVFADLVLIMLFIWYFSYKKIIPLIYSPFQY